MVVPKRHYRLVGNSVLYLDVRCSDFVQKTVSADRFHSFPHFSSFGILPPFTYFQIYYSFIILSFAAAEPKHPIQRPYINDEFQCSNNWLPPPVVMMLDVHFSICLSICGKKLT
jgi:hypothetical protein